MPDLQYDISRCVDSASLPWEPYDPPGWPSGLRVRTLRRLESDGSLRSAILDVPAGWSSAGWHICAADEQAYVLSGDIRIGDDSYGADGFFFFPGGGNRGPVASKGGARLVLILGGPQSFELSSPEEKAAPASVSHPSVLACPAFEPEIHGRKTGTTRRVLWEDSVTGADTRFLTVGPGFEGRGANWHPVHEEIFCLEGDIGPDDTRLMSPGYYLHNPAYGVHGFHEHSNGGASVLEWHDGKWSLNLYEGDKEIQ